MIIPKREVDNTVIEVKFLIGLVDQIGYIDFVVLF